MATFTIEHKRTLVQNPRGKKRVVKTEIETFTLTPKMTKEGEWWTISVGYGYDRHLKHERVMSCSQYNSHMMHNYQRPHKGDIWRCGERVFEIGEMRGFIYNYFDLLENGVKVAEVFHEEYYKD